MLNEFGYGPIKVSGTLDNGTREAIERFEREADVAATLWHPSSHFDWVRPGILLYGASPSGVTADMS